MLNFADAFNLLMVQFWTNVFPILVVIVGGYLIKEIQPILRSVAARMNYQVDEANEVRITAAVTKWVLAAESIFEDQVQKGLAAKADAGATKLSFALAGIAKDLPTVTEDEARIHIEAALQAQKLGPAKPALTQEVKTVVNDATVIPILTTVTGTK
jgi:hypothetical protein